MFHQNECIKQIINIKMFKNKRYFRVLKTFLILSIFLIVYEKYFYYKINKSLNELTEIKKEISVVKPKPKLILFYKAPYDYSGASFNCRYECLGTTDERLIKIADAVVLHGWIFPKHKIPNYRDPKQRWVYLLNESPANTYYHSKEYNSSLYNNLFNWTITYRTDSDIPYDIWIVRELKRKPKQLDIPKKKKLAIIIMSNCKNKDRTNLVKEIQRLSPEGMVDFYGKCGKHCNSSCRDFIKDYSFYLAFENSYYCKDYITEKFWWNGLLNHAVPVVKGAYKKDYLKQAPKNSFIHVDDFNSTKALVDYMMHLHENQKEYEEYHKWRLDYYISVVYTRYYCGLCDKLHSDTTEKVYERFDEWFNSCKGFRI